MIPCRRTGSSRSTLQGGWACGRGRGTSGGGGDTFIRCIFCKRPSDDSRSVEHIVPESLGNTEHTLPAGVVCDGCNNYFARKVEDPFLNSEMVREMRTLRGIPNKRGLHVSVERLVFPGLPARLTGAGPDRLMLDLTDEGARWFGERSGVLRFVASPPPPERVASRFVAKAGLEALASKAVRAGLGTDEIVDHAGLDAVRDWARRGDPRTNWPLHVRRLYEMGRKVPDAQGRHWETLHEFDLLYTDEEELYFVLVIFGIEMVINLGGPEIDGYVRWLKEHDNVSPLYWGRNASV